MTFRVLVTGATGLVGRAVLAQVPRDWSVRALARGGAPDRSSSEVEWCSADLERPETLRGRLDGCHGVIHCAGIMTGDERDFRLNRDGTRALHEEGCRAGVRSFAYVSSTAVYGEGRHLDAEEHTPRTGTSSYARSKCEAEDVVLASDSGIVGTVLRPCMITGAGDRNLAPAVRMLLQAEEVLLPGHGANGIDLVLADDVARLLVRAITAARGGAFHVTGGRPAPLGEVLREAAEATGCTPRWRSLPFAEARAELEQRARAGSLAPFEPALFAIAAVERTYSIARARRELGFVPDPRPPLVVALAPPART